MPLKLILCAAIAALSLAPCLAAWAQVWPSQPIKIVVPTPAGTSADALARQVGEQLARDLGQPVVIENKTPGLAGITYASRQKADGYTLMIGVGGFAIFPVIYKNLSFDPVKDFTPITQLALTPLIFVTRPDSPMGNLTDVVARAKATPGKLMYGSMGKSSTSHLVAESFMRVAGVRLTHVPYKGSTGIAADVISGQLDFAIVDPVSTLELVKAGRLKALGVASPARIPAIPDVQTVADAGLDFSAVGWVGLFAPAGLAPEIAQKINASANRTMASPGMRTFLAKSGSIPVEPAPSPEQWRKKFNEYVDTWGDLAKAAKMGDE
jgi:tripartite-type tricarboxylate transporter receptor subunit TctC